jgi:hypothetical protein
VGGTRIFEVLWLEMEVDERLLDWFGINPTRLRLALDVSCIPESPLDIVRRMVLIMCKREKSGVRG